MRWSSCTVLVSQIDGSARPHALGGKGKAPAVGRAHLIGLIEVLRLPQNTPSVASGRKLKAQ